MVIIAKCPDLPDEVLCLTFNIVGLMHHNVHPFLKKTFTLGINEGAAFTVWPIVLPDKASSPDP
jgi:hypothetical protein